MSSFPVFAMALALDGAAASVSVSVSVLARFAESAIGTNDGALAGEFSLEFKGLP